MSQQHKYYIKPNLPLHELVPAYRQLIFNFGPGYHPDTKVWSYRPKLDGNEMFWLSEANIVLFHEMPEGLLYNVGSQVVHELIYYQGNIPGRKPYK